MMLARGTFDVAITPVPAEPDAAPDAHGRMRIAKTYHGDIEGVGEGEMLATMGPDQSGAYVAIERVRGRVNGREGAFTIIHRGLMDQGAQDLAITVSPGSGVGALTGVAGVYVLTLEDGVHRYALDYTLPET
ncbi:MAG: DUF3224 domain-containing protein [Brevundimonas sp.]|nr:MAG: DUF3224 domain-containing protein [Brevundimonas sp.]